MCIVANKIQNEIILQYFNECLMMQQTCPENRRRGKVDRYGSRGSTRTTQKNKSQRKKIVEVIISLHTLAEKTKWDYGTLHII